MDAKLNMATQNNTTQADIAEIRAEFSRQQWPHLYYFVHCEAKHHIQLLINHIDALEARLAALEGNTKKPKCSCAELDIHGFDNKYCKVHGDFREI